jgi:hypothetical protein
MNPEINVIFKNSHTTLENTLHLHCKHHLLRLFSKVITTCSENRQKWIGLAVPCVQNAERFDVKTRVLSVQQVIYFKGLAQHVRTQPAVAGM